MGRTDPIQISAPSVPSEVSSIQEQVITPEPHSSITNLGVNANLAAFKLNMRRCIKQFHVATKNIDGSSPSQLDDAIDAHADAMADALKEFILSLKVTINIPAAPVSGTCTGVTVGAPAPHAITAQPVVGTASVSGDSVAGMVALS